MIKIILATFSLTFFNYSQTVDTVSNILNQPEYIIKFADHLFCQRDYLRSADEYLRISESMRDEKINFKIALSFSAIGDYSKSKIMFSKFKQSSQYYNSSKLEIMKILLLEDNFSELRKYFISDSTASDNPIDSSEHKLYFLTCLKDQGTIPSYNEFIKPFDFSEREEARILYDMRINPHKKNPLAASIISAIIPGAGKLYTGEISDGIFAFITTGLFSFLAYDNFKAKHEFRGWLFTGLAAMFYAGNVYGSYASAQIYNTRFKFEFNLRLDSFIKTNNYCIPQYEFCN